MDTPPRSELVLVCDVAGLDDCDVDLRLVETLARLQLTAQRYGVTLRLRNASLRLRQLLELVGLSGVLPCNDSFPPD